ncbi:MAG TPA: hypothetical protein PK156_26880, partial [Polyangium sp.]|nr:hypothetical protein [Polyangium sp.]
MYEFCSGLAALHDYGLAHGNIDDGCFREGTLERGILCNLEFAQDGLDNPETDRDRFISYLEVRGARKIDDEIWQNHWKALLAGGSLNVNAMKDRLKALVLKDRHRAVVYWRSKSRELSATRRTQTFVHPMPSIEATLKIEYDGTRFFVAEVAGEVRINNRAFKAGDELPQSCVIVLGNPSRTWTERYSITFDQSHPEVI